MPFKIYNALIIVLSSTRKVITMEKSGCIDVPCEGVGGEGGGGEGGISRRTGSRN